MDRYASPNDHFFLKKDDHDDQEAQFDSTGHEAPQDFHDLLLSPSVPRSVLYRREPSHPPSPSSSRITVFPSNPVAAGNAESDWDIPRSKSAGDGHATTELKRRYVGSKPLGAKRKVLDSSIVNEQPEIGASKTFPPFARS